MIFTDSGVSSVSQSLYRWELTEYISEAFVILACAGELVADLGERWLGDQQKRHLERRSTILLVAALSISLISLVRTNELSGSVIGSLGEKARIADEKAQSALDKSGTAETKADAAGKKADGIEKRLDIASAQMGNLEKDIVAQGPRAKLLVKAAPELIRKLTPFAGQRVELFVCGQRGLTDQETLDTWGAIANILDSDTVAGVVGAKWKLVPTNLNFAGNCGAAKGLGQGVGVLVSKGASRSVVEAATALGRGLAKALPPSPNKMPSLIDPDFAKMTVDRGFQSKDAPWTIVAYDPDLITIVIGEHP